MKYSYYSIKKSVQNIIYKEKGSKFIGFAFRVDDEDEAKNRLEDLKNQFTDATHHCYAYRIGLEGELYRVNDDGEPSGSAGLPIYNQILAKEITNVLVVSVRYYGGTKLGVSGLIKAYKISAQLTLEEVIIVENHLTEKMSITCSYEDQGSVMRLIDKYSIKVIETSFTNICSLQISIRKEKQNEFIKAFEPLYQVKIETNN